MQAELASHLLIVGVLGSVLPHLPECAGDNYSFEDGGQDNNSVQG
jgi:hypothetical protein